MLVQVMVNDRLLLIIGSPRYRICHVLFSFAYSLRIRTLFGFPSLALGSFLAKIHCVLIAICVHSMTYELGKRMSAGVHVYIFLGVGQLLRYSTDLATNPSTYIQVTDRVHSSSMDPELVQGAIPGTR
jgi:hypothetical protein